MLLAKYWETAIVLTLNELMSKVRCTSLMSKLFTISKYRPGVIKVLEIFSTQWDCFVTSTHSKHIPQNVWQLVVAIM